ncbi:MAG TPA: aminotransferase class I/II-fold pyridoxal phosphate-dependent enzyme [Gemmatimonadetes bacterium]|nr:aminotransferase class I/II-fold pyridoxal phosphate-dependent enzyme [Gemmatimonadota bacterium]HIL89358.1 aminotransferase class I/II-fold pyridoxal phosphate-dependent enzyme [Gemmatimonadota bacterium]
MKPLSRSVSSMPRSGIRVIMDRAFGLTDCIRLEVGEPNFPTPQHVIEAADEAARSGKTRYTENPGIPELRSRIAEIFTEDTGRKTEVGDVVVTTGAMAALYTTLMSIADPGDEVIVMSPSWPNYLMQMTLLGIRPVTVSTNETNGHVPTIEQLESAVSVRTKAVLLNSPCNPTGAVINQTQMARIIDFARRADIYVISDEVYDKIVYEGTHVSAASYDSDGRVVCIHSFSKTYSMTGWRVGYAVAPPEIATLIRKCQEPTVSCVNAPAQYAALAALNGPQEIIGEMRDAYRERRDEVNRLLSSSGISALNPAGAFYIWVDISSSQRSDVDFAMDLVDKHQVTVVPGSTFGPSNEDRVRISLATTPDQLYEGIRRLIEESRS